MAAQVAVLVLDELQRVLSANSGGTELLAEGPLREEGGRLRTGDVKLEEALQAAVRPPYRQTLLVMPCHSPPTLALLVCGLRPLAAERREAPRVLVLVSRLDRRLGVSPADTVEVYGLTRAESELLAALIAGE